MDDQSRLGRLEAKVERTLAASNVRIVVTGAGGWLGMATLELLNAALGQSITTRVACFGSSRKTLELLDGTKIFQRPVADLPRLESYPTLLLHMAFPTKDRAEAMDEADYIAACRQLSRTVLDALDRIGTQSVFVASSGAAAQASDPSASPAMRLYGRLKCEDEEAFAAWTERGDRRAVIARIFNLSGPHINKHQSYALASFILDALAGSPIEIRAPHRVIRSYVAIREMVSLVLALLLDRRSGVTRFDTGGQARELGDVAATVARAVRNVSIERPPVGHNRVDEYVGDGTAYDALLAERGITPVTFVQQVVETAEFLSYFQSQSMPNRVALGVEPC